MKIKLEHKNMSKALYRFYLNNGKKRSYGK